MSATCLRQPPVHDAVIPEMIGRAGMLFVDFDHTLFACNSTELFISSCRPSAVVAVIDFVIRGCLPWKLTRAPQWYRLRDYVCVLAILSLTPWNVMRWRRIAPGLYARYENRTLASLLTGMSTQRIVIVSFGLRFIIRALLADNFLSSVPLLAAPTVAKPAFFRHGKLSQVRQSYDEQLIATSTFITDSTDDADLLEVVETPCLIKPCGEKYQAAQSLYLPLRYTVLAKYPRWYTLDQFLFVDVAIAVTAVSSGSITFLHAVLIAPFFVMALMCIYEIGYFENDTRATKLEAFPTLSRKEAAFAHYPIRVHPWIWSTTLSLIGAWIAVRIGALPKSHFVATLCLWNGGLMLLRAVFFFYNSVPVFTRLYFYPLLQLLKYSAIFLVLAPTTTGAMLVLAQIMTMYTIYIVYRLNGDKQKLPREELRSIIFTLAITVSLFGGTYNLRTETFTLITAVSWLAFRMLRTAGVKAYKRHHLIQTTLHGNEA